MVVCLGQRRLSTVSSFQPAQRNLKQGKKWHWEARTAPTWGCSGFFAGKRQDRGAGGFAGKRRDKDMVGKGMQHSRQGTTRVWLGTDL